MPKLSARRVAKHTETPDGLEMSKGEKIALMDAKLGKYAAGDEAALSAEDKRKAWQRLQTALKAMLVGLFFGGGCCLPVGVCVPQICSLRTSFNDKHNAVV